MKKVVEFNNKESKLQEQDNILNIDHEELTEYPYLNKMKDEYHNIEIPETLKSKIEKSIMEGKKENMKNTAYKYIKRGATVSAAALLTVIVLANSNQTISHAMQNIPIIGSIIEVVTFRTYKDKTNDYEANIEVPKIVADEQDESLKNAADEVNKTVEDYTNMIIEQYNADMKASEGEGHYAVDTSYEVITNGDRLFTLRIDTVVAMGGSNSFSKFYHINKETGKVITLEDLFNEESDYINIISNNIKEQMRAQMAADESITYFLDNEETKEWNFKEIKKDHNFYINDKENLVIVFDKYEAAPGYMGMVEFEIPENLITGIRK